MIEVNVRRVLVPAVALVVALAAVPPAGTAAEELLIGYVALKNDPRYTVKRTFASYLTEALGSPYVGAKVAIEESKFVGSAVGVEFKLKRRRAKSEGRLVKSALKLVDDGARYILVDAPAALVDEVARATEDLDVLLFNVTARDDVLRQEQCRSHLLHVIPSHAMTTDSLVQYLISKKWREVLVLTGPRPEDGQLTAAFERSAERFGIEIVEQRPFVLSNDPREREQNNVALLTAGAEYDVVFVADTDGEFARDVPYQTVQPRLVVGSEGLAAAAWHWSWERHGAPQLEKRFQKKAKRPMRDQDWAAWMAVKGVVEAVLRTEGGDFAAVRDYLLGDEVVLDGFKGNRLNFRPWNRQLRQPVLLVTHNWVVDRAPLRGYLHATNNLDTLGFDERDTRCEL
jgi:ABC transporter substrate binding protein (PQQ-dependent alcohol dehydrogenase system)